MSLSGWSCFATCAWSASEGDGFAEVRSSVDSGARDCKWNQQDQRPCRAVDGLPLIFVGSASSMARSDAVEQFAQETLKTIRNFNVMLRSSQLQGSNLCCFESRTVIRQLLDDSASTHFDRRRPKKIETWSSTCWADFLMWSYVSILFYHIWIYVLVAFIFKTV